MLNNTELTALQAFDPANHKLLSSRKCTRVIMPRVHSVNMWETEYEGVDGVVIDFRVLEHETPPTFGRKEGEENRAARTLIRKHYKVTDRHRLNLAVQLLISAGGKYISNILDKQNRELAQGRNDDELTTLQAFDPTNHKLLSSRVCSHLTLSRGHTVNMWETEYEGVDEIVIDFRVLEHETPSTLSRRKPMSDEEIAAARILIREHYKVTQRDRLFFETKLLTTAGMQYVAGRMEKQNRELAQGRERGQQ